ncbi:hypothetical protein DL768_008696 [Monosporascus sp. mg162]|nr:hypothetical protein DL768_008696 [Monosporascus sp. mg162]
MATKEPIDDDRFQLHLGKARNFLPLNPAGDLLSSDHLVKSILLAGSSGDATKDCFTHVAVLSSPFNGLGKDRQNAWEKAHDEDGHDVYYAKKMDEKGKPYYWTIKFEGLDTNERGNGMPNGKHVTINGTQYLDVGMVTHTVGNANFTFSKTA